MGKKRESKRYILYKIISIDDLINEDELIETYLQDKNIDRLIQGRVTINKNELNHFFWNLIRKLFGVTGSVKSGFYILKHEKNIGVITCSKDFYHEILALMGVITEINQVKCQVVVLKTSGTIKSLREYLKEKNINFKLPPPQKKHSKKDHK